MVKTKVQILNEGRYDSFVKEIVQDIMYHIKESEGEKDVVVDFMLPYDNICVLVFIIKHTWVTYIVYFIFYGLKTRINIF